MPVDSPEFEALCEKEEARLTALGGVPPYRRIMQGRYLYIVSERDLPPELPVVNDV